MAAPTSDLAPPPLEEPDLAAVRAFVGPVAFCGVRAFVGRTPQNHSAGGTPTLKYTMMAGRKVQEQPVDPEVFKRHRLGEPLTFFKSPLGASWLSCDGNEVGHHDAGVRIDRKVLRSLPANAITGVRWKLIREIPRRCADYVTADATRSQFRLDLAGHTHAVGATAAPNNVASVGA